MSNSIFGRIPSVTKNLLIINVIIFLFGMLFPAKTQAMEDLFALHYISSPGFEPWQLFTYMFMHGNFTHLFFNMFALLMFGSMLEWTMGQRRFLFFYISCGIGAALVQMGVFAVILSKYQTMLFPLPYDEIVSQGWDAMHQGLVFTDSTLQSISSLVNVPCVGASGAIFGLLLAFAMLYPNHEMYLMFIPIPIKAKWMVLGYCLLELSLGIGGVADGVAHFAHLGGALIGFIILFYWKKKGAFGGRY